TGRISRTSKLRVSRKPGPSSKPRRQSRLQPNRPDGRLSPSPPSPRPSRGRDERSSLLEGRGEGLSPRAVHAVSAVPPHPDRKGDPTSPRKRGEVEEESG